MPHEGPAHTAEIVQGLLDAYRQGYFPMANPGSDCRPVIEWFNPARRGILPLDTFHIPSSLRQRVRSRRFRITSDQAFEQVIQACAEPTASPDRNQTWIDGRITAAYTALHHAGHAHSIEAWLPSPTGEPVLVGGLYGVHIGGLFAGESMFSRPALGGTDASKVSLVHLVAHLRRQGFTLLDTQFSNPHLAQFGAVEVPRTRYLRLLATAVAASTPWEPFQAALP